MDKSQVSQKGQFHAIILPVAPQPDTLAAIFLLQTFGEAQFSGAKDAKIEILSTLPAGETAASLEQKGYILIDIAGGKFDHHTQNTKTTASRLVAEYLGVAEDPALAKLLEYARRDDVFGRGTVSEDPLDRAFGLSGLIKNLNRSFSDNPTEVAKIASVIFLAHYQEEVRRTKELPEEFAAKLREGKVSITEARQRDKKLRVVFIESDNTGLAGYLRSQNGGKFDAVVQRMPGGYVNILTRPTKRVDLRYLAALLRMRELEVQRKTMDMDMNGRELMRPARHPKIKEWYYDPATNSIQNGGLRPGEISPTQIPWREFPAIVEQGLAGNISR